MSGKQAEKPRDIIAEKLARGAQHVQQVERERHEAIQSDTGRMLEHHFNQYLVENIPVADIRLLPDFIQPRVRGLDDSYDRSNEDMQELMKSIREEGVLVPTLVMHDRDDDGNTFYRLIAGERRYNAVKYNAEDDGLPMTEAKLLAYVMPTMTWDRVAVIAMMENEDRKDLTNLQRAIWLARFQHAFPEKKLVKTELAQKWGVSRKHVHSAVRLCALLSPFVILDKNASGEQQESVKATLAKLAAVSVNSLQAVADTNKDAVDNGYAVIRRYLESGKLGEPRQPVAPDIEHLHGTVKINHNKGVVKVNAEIRLGEGGMEALSVLDEIRARLMTMIEGGKTG